MSERQPLKGILADANSACLSISSQGDVSLFISVLPGQLSEGEAQSFRQQWLWLRWRPNTEGGQVRCPTLALCAEA